MSTPTRYVPKNTDEEYLSRNWFDGDESDVRMRRIKMVKVRKPHRCALASLVREDGEHQIQPGERALVESGLIDDNWERVYTCCQCMDFEIQQEQEEMGDS